MFKHQPRNSKEFNDDKSIIGSDGSLTGISCQNSTFRRTKYIKLKIKPVESIIIEKQK